MPIDTGYQRALSLAKAGKLLEAQALLLAIDTPEAEKLLTKVNAAIAARGTGQATEQTKQNPSEQIRQGKAAKPIDKLSPEVKTKQKTKPKTDPKQAAIGAVILLFICAFSCFAMQPKPYDESTPENKVRAAVGYAFGRTTMDSIGEVVVSDGQIYVSFPLSTISEEWALKDANLNMPKLICELRDRGFVNQQYAFTGLVPVIDALGNESMTRGIQVVVSAATIAAINCESARNYAVNLEAIADSYDVAPVLR